MQNPLVLTLVAALASQLVSASYPFNTVDLLNEFPPCAVSLVVSVMAARVASRYPSLTQSIANLLFARLCGYQHQQGGHLPDLQQFALHYTR